MKLLTTKAIVGLIALVVFGVLCVLIYVYAPYVALNWFTTPELREAQTTYDVSVTNLNLLTLMVGIEQYQSVRGEWPPSLSDLIASWSEITKGSRFFESKVTAPDISLVDIRNFTYSVNGSTFKLCSLLPVPDGKPACLTEMDLEGS